LAITFGSWKFDVHGDKRVEDAKAFIEKHPNLIFVSTDRGLKYDRVAAAQPAL
jgi:hypothetical protein